MKRAAAALVILAAIAACDRPGGEGPSSAGQPAKLTLNAAAESLLAEGHAAYKKQEFGTAKDLWLKSVPIAQARADLHAQAELYTWLGLAAWRLGDLDSARVWQQRAIRLRGQLPAPNELWRSVNALGLLELSESRNKSAAGLFEQSLKLATQERSSEGVAKATGNAALAYGNLGDLHRARAGHRAMRAAGRRLGDTRVEANGLANEAMVDIWEGDPATAKLRLDSARRLYQTIPDAVGRQNALGQLATAYELSGDFGAAFSVLDSALTLARKHALTENTVEILRILGEIHVRLGDAARAARYFDEAESLARKGGLEADLPSILRGSAAASMKLGNLPRAQKKTAEARKLHRAAEEPLEEVDDILLLAELAERTGRGGEASSHLRVADSIASRTGVIVASTAVALAAAWTSEVRGEPKAVLMHVRNIRSGNGLQPAEIRAIADSRAARAFLRLNATDSALAAGEKAVAAIERVRRGIAGNPITSAYLAERSDVYGDYIVALLRAGRSEEAFAVADRARSRSLLEHLTSVSRRRGDQTGPQDLIESEAVLRRIEALSRALARAPRRSGARGGSESSGDASAELETARAQYERLLIRGSQHSDGSAAILGAAGSALPNVRRVLEKDEVLIEYFLGSDTLYAFAVSSKAFRVLRSASNPAVIASRVRLLKDLWGSPRNDWRTGVSVSAALEQMLIDPARRAGMLEGARRIVIVPHGIIAQVPFGALMNRASGKYLIQDYQVLESPSSSALVALRSRRVTLPNSETRNEAFAPFPRELPGSATEVRAFARTMRRAAARLERKATERAVRSALESGSVVHLATHGVLNFRNPLFSRVDLVPAAERRGSSANWDNDGRMEVRELLGLHVRSPLVFLSGCETGGSDDWSDSGVRSTGDLTLSRALLSAGALNVVSALWRIDDEGAAKFAETFYTNLRVTGVTESLALAQRSLVADRRFNSPYYWGAYVVSGEGRTAGPSRK